MHSHVTNTPHNERKPRNRTQHKKTRKKQEELPTTLEEQQAERYTPTNQTIQQTKVDGVQKEREKCMLKKIFLCVALCASFHVSNAYAQTPSHQDHTYAQIGNQKLLLDLYIPHPKPNTPPPLIVYIHGGAWLTGNKDEFTNYILNREALKRGFAGASISYRLTSQSTKPTFPTQLHDVKAAIRFLRARASTFGYDPNRIAVFGTSAGGHLAALLGTSCGVLAAEGNVGMTGTSSCVQAVVDLFGPTDLVNMNTHITNPPGSDVDHDAPGSPESMLLGLPKGIGDLRRNYNNKTNPYPYYRGIAELANPITHVDPTDPPFFIAHGKQDRLVPLKQSKLLADALKQAGVRVEYHEVADKGHGDVGDATELLALQFLVNVFNQTPKPEPMPPEPASPEPRSTETKTETTSGDSGPTPPSPDTRQIEQTSPETPNQTIDNTQTTPDNKTPSRASSGCVCGPSQAPSWAWIGVLFLIFWAGRPKHQHPKKEEKPSL
jgi:acetyl esterase/lipase